MQELASRTLYHFTGRPHPKEDSANFDTLCKILRSMTVRACDVGGSHNGIRIRRDPSRGLLNGEPIEQSVTCLCDIPRSLLGVHARRYGQFGVGVCRAAVVKMGTRPVIYVPVFRTVGGSWAEGHLAEVSNVLDGLQRFSAEPPPERSRVVDAPAIDVDDALWEASGLIKREYLAFLKFWDVNLPDDHDENFYLEREWRKFGDLPLASCLSEIIAPPDYHDELKAIIAELRVGDRYLLGEITYSSVPDVQGQP
ncbi:abortive infection system antitoxin AbiGi family protein [Silanimonas sp.]|uniref:abortive infection system antitoxin AbiGi family protein n=1 Tax=Silanimonas sp. TaxID=1929290 RepID=UPI0022C13E97|nr:abortive infection system antitoxin AbiGi family protein [Silanimonas sp.]MCZ8164979.1 abortive infection system antitoxin AbiGi family protein [Silanimonas sp.]